MSTTPSPARHAGKKHDTNYAEQYSKFAAKIRATAGATLRAQAAVSAMHKKGKRAKTATGRWHHILKCAGKKDLRFALPKSVDLDSPKKKDGDGLAKYFQDNEDKDLNKEKITWTWLVCAVWGIDPDQTKPGWEHFECSHRCCEIGIEDGYRCIDPQCLTWESKSDNQSRANPACRFVLPGDSMHVCARAAGGVHDPPCH